MLKEKFIYLMTGALILSMFFTCSLFTDKNVDDFKDKANKSSLWPKRIGGADDDIATGIVQDTEGNNFIVGKITGIADINGDNDFIDNNEEISGCYGNSDILISKFNSNGIYLWSKRLGGLDDDYGKGVATDPNGNVINAGYINGDADLNGDGDSADGGGESSAGYGSYDIFIIKLNSSGTYQWSKRLGGEMLDSCESIATDSSGNVYITGFANGTADINGDGDFIDDLEVPVNNNWSDILIVKFNSSGVYQWAKRLGGINQDHGYGIDVDLNGNVYIAGYIIGYADLNGDNDSTDGGAESPAGYDNYDIVVAKFNSTGAYQWSKRLGGINDDAGYGLKIENNNIFITGYIDGDADLNGDGDSTDGGSESSEGFGSGDIFMVKFNLDGVFQWAKRVGGANFDSGYGIAVDLNGNIILTGKVNGNTDINGDGDFEDGGAESSAGYGNDDIFAVKFNPSAVYMWSVRLGGIENDNANDLIADSNGNIYITGRVYGNADMNGDSDSTDGGAELSSGYGNNDIFITKIIL